MKTSKKGLQTIKDFEGLRLLAYQCSAKKWTIGYGHTGKVKGKKINKYTFISEDEASALLKIDIVKYEKIVNRYDKKYKWTQQEFDALVSFAFNIGSITQLTAFGTRSKETIAQKIPLYCKAGGVVQKGLARRREIERIMFLKK